jgi:predicted nucleic acid-binding protein
MDWQPSQMVMRRWNRSFASRRSGNCVGEYRYGIQQSRDRQRYEQWLTETICNYRVLDVDEETARSYATIRTELKRAGTPIPSNDVWITALCRQHSFSLLSRDRHFDLVRGDSSLRQELWDLAGKSEGPFDHPSPEILIHPSVARKGRTLPMPPRRPVGLEEKEARNVKVLQNRKIENRTGQNSRKWRLKISRTDRHPPISLPCRC